MSAPRAETIYYRRSRFTAHLPIDRRYTAAHYWLLEEASGVWRIGFTRFATRMLGDVVDYEFSVGPGAQVSVGEAIGSVEGFKAVTTVFAVADGEFFGVNAALEADPSLIDADPHRRGWLYQVRGTPEPDSVDVHGYVAILDATIDKLLRSRHDTGENG
ncbi:MAG: glycine cleavage system protein H [Acidobacteriota bacterium]